MTIIADIHPHDGLLTSSFSEETCPDGCSGKTYIPEKFSGIEKPLTLCHWNASASTVQMSNGAGNSANLGMETDDAIVVVPMETPRALRGFTVLLVAVQQRPPIHTICWPWLAIHSLLHLLLYPLPVITRGRPMQIID
jgi:hypothetical protein